MAAKLARFSWLPGGLAAVVVLVIGRLLAPDAGAALEGKLYDRIQRFAAVPASDIVIVSIDAESGEKLGEWPWAPDVHATLIERLQAQGARVIAWATPFGTPSGANETRSIRGALALLESSGLGTTQQALQLRRLLRTSSARLDSDSHLANAIRAHGRVVLPVEVRLTRGEPASRSGLPASMLIGANVGTGLPGAVQLRRPNERFLHAASAFGHLGFEADPDGVVRTDAVAVRTGEGSLPSLATAIVGAALNVAPNDMVITPASLRLGDRALALDARQRLLPQFASRGAFKELPYWRVWSGDIADADLQGKIVVVGFADPAVEYASTLSTPLGAELPSVTVVASAAASMLNATTYSRPTLAVAVEWIAMLGVVAIAAFLLPAAGIATATVAAGVAIAMLAIGEIGLLTSMRVWAHLALPCIAMAAGYSLYLVSELIRRANVRSANAGKDSTASLRALGQTFQKQGQLDLAFETYRRCPLDAPTMELLYYLGLDFERRHQNQKAEAVYAYIASRDPGYRDLRARRARIRTEPEPLRREPPTQPPPRSVQPSPIAHPRPDPSTLEPSPGTRTLGRYEVVRELGKGAMGVVYLGRDPKINRVVAIKAIPLAEEFEEEDLEEARARFFREAEMAGRLNHPCIVTVYDAGEDQGLAYIAMEYLRGEHLSHYTDPARLLPVHTVLSLGARVADALDYAHRQNVVHRDIKPANIMYNSDTDELKITDFGIARLTDTSRTKTGIVLGTPSFMSPEQLEGRTLDGRSDQFALGVSLYQLLCGQLPFRAESMPRLMQKIATEDHPPIRSVRPELPASIEGIFDRVLAKSADYRYATCAEFALALRQCEQQLTPKRERTEHEWLLP